MIGRESPVDEKDKTIQGLLQDIARWKNRAVEAAERACVECERLDADCSKCRMMKIKEEAART